MALRGQGTTVASSDREYAAGKNMIVPWDLSGDPKDNADYEKKLGSGDATHAAAIVSFDKATKAATLADGLTNKTGIVSRRPWDPDSFVLRLFEKGGKKKAASWMPRLVSDASHEHRKRAQHSTIVVDQCDPQTWAWLVDALRLVATEAPVDDPEIEFAASGFLGMLFEDKKKAGAIRKTRGALALNVNQRAGYVTDGVAYAQLWHVFTMLRSGRETSVESCVPSERAELGLLSDVKFIGRRGHYMMTPLERGPEVVSELPGSTAPAAGLDAVGSLYIASSGPDDFAKDTILMGVDAKSNQPIIPRRKSKGIKVYVKVPYPNVPTAPKQQYPPPPGDGGPYSQCATLIRVYGPPNVGKYIHSGAGTAYPWMQVGLKVTVNGCANAVNNGTFTITAYNPNTQELDTNNAASVDEHSGTVPPIPPGAKVCPAVGSEAQPPYTANWMPTTIGHGFTAGDFEAMYVKFRLPELVTSDAALDVFMDLATDAAYGGGESTKVMFHYRITAKGAVPGSYTRVDRTFDSTDGLDETAWHHGRFTIPHSAIADKEGGIVELWIGVRAESTGPDFGLGEIQFVVTQRAGAVQGFAFV